MTSTRGSLRQRLALRSASAQLPTHSGVAAGRGRPWARTCSAGVRGEVDHDAVRVDVGSCCCALCTLPVASVASNLTRMIAL